MSQNLSSLRALVVLCHPNRTGFNQAIARAAVQYLETHYHVDFIDLYRSHFDPCLPESEIPRKFSFDETTLHFSNLAKDADVMVFVHPDWWGGPPALLKGFIDRVFRPGIAYEFAGSDYAPKTEMAAKKKAALFAGKSAFVFSTTDHAAPKGSDYPPAQIWKTNIFDYCGIADAQVHTFFETYNSTYEARHQWIESVATKLHHGLDQKNKQ